jgi:hypothetical protein
MASVTLEKKGFGHLFSEEKEPDPASVTDPAPEMGYGGGSETWSRALITMVCNKL